MQVHPESGLVDDIVSAQKHQHDLESQGRSEELQRLEHREKVLSELKYPESGFITHASMVLAGVAMLVTGLVFILRYDPAWDKSSLSFVLPVLSVGLSVFIICGGVYWLVMDFRRNLWPCQTDNLVKLEKEMSQKVVLPMSPQEALAIRQKQDEKRRREDAKNEKTRPLLLLTSDRIKILEDLYGIYSGGRDHIDCNGISAILVDCMTGGGQTSLAEARDFMDQIDLDGDKLLQRNEFYTFMLNRWSKDSPIAGDYPSLHHFLVDLHESRVQQSTPLITEEGVPSVMSAVRVSELSEQEKLVYEQELVKDLYLWYDKDGEGAIDCNGLLALMLDLVTGEDPSLSQVNEFMDEIDEDGDRCVQQEELVSWMMNRWVSYSPQAKLYGNSLAKFLSVAYPVVQQKLVQRFCAKHNVSRPPTAVEPAPPAMRVTDEAKVSKQEPKKDKEERQNKKTETRDAVPPAEMVPADVGDTEVHETKSAPAADAPPAAEATSTTTDDDIGGQNAIEKSVLEEIESETGGAAASQEEQSIPGVDSSCEEKTTDVATSADGEGSTSSTDFTM